MVYSAARMSPGRATAGVRAPCPAGRHGLGHQSRVRFLLSDHARYITGHTLVGDGGATLSGPERASE